MADNMEHAQTINVENSFDDFVRSFGGQLVRELISKSPNFKNADYLFRQESVVAELKCLQKNVLTSEEYTRKIADLHEKWIQKRLVRDPGFGPFELQTKDLPEVCQREFFAIIKKPIHRAIQEANRQIRETKDHFRLQNGKGLLLLVNDGNYSFETETVLYLVNQVLLHGYSQINSMIYFTVNMPARVPNIEFDFLVWVPVKRPDRPPVSSEFLDRIREDWFAHYRKITGTPVPSFFMGKPDQLYGIKFIQPSPQPV